jgi:hypothetical protein
MIIPRDVVEGEVEGKGTVPVGRVSACRSTMYSRMWSLNLRSSFETEEKRGGTGGK